MSKKTPEFYTTETGQERHAPRSHFPVVGMGASAGGLEAFKRFFQVMPADSGMAFVLIQHLDPTRESLMAELLTGSTAMQVVQITDNTRVEPNQVYLIRPNAYLTIRDGILRLSEPTETRGMRKPIDIFLRSLAQDQQERGIAIILSGTGTDGTVGIKEIKGAGGIVLVQDPQTASHDGMPRSAINTSLVDFILPAEKMPDVLLEYARHPYLKTNANAEPAAYISERFDEIITFLRVRQDFDFRCYKKGTLMRRIQRRMSLNRIHRSADYLTYLHQHPAELEALARDLMISVTYFFRDPEAWDYLVNEVLRTLAQQQHEGLPLRIWVPGCATGEEAYTLAMLLIEQLQAQQKNPRIQLFASDFNHQALGFARTGLYPDSIAADVSPVRLQRFFQKEEHYYRVNKEVRDLVTFAVQNLISDPPFGKLDLISCRNLLIYLEPEIQEKVIGLFHFALRADGYLFLGNAETIGSQTDLFETVSKKWRLYRRIGPTRPNKVTLPIPAITRPSRTLEFEPGRPPVLPRSGQLGDIAQHIVLERYTKACVLVNRNFEILYLFGPTYDYLVQPVGKLTADLLTWAHEGLRTRLRIALHDALRSGKTVTVDGIRLQRGEEFADVICTVEPLAKPKAVEGFLLIAFADQTAAPPDKTTMPQKTSDDDSTISQLEYELNLARDELKSVTEQLESSNEEFKATNEEVMSINEELQSTNEELETSKEELQSVNEELVTTNQQLESKNLALEVANDDLKNLLTSTDIATLFLDKQFCIRRFTPAITRLMRLIPTDTGRPVEDINCHFNSKILLQDAAAVLEQLVPEKTEIQTDDGHWYIQRVLPYRTEDNRIDGVVVTFHEITEHKLAENQHRFLVTFYDAIRLLQDPEEIMATTAQVTGEYFGVTRCAYGYLDALQTQVTIDRDYCNNVATQVGTYSVTRWDVGLLRELQQGKSLVIEDAHHDPRTGTLEEFLFAAHDARSLLIVPLLREQHMVAIFLLSHHRPRTWSATEVNLVRQVAERTWLVVKNAQANKAHQLSEERFRIALKNAPIMVFYQDRELRYTWIQESAAACAVAPAQLGKRDRDLLERPEDAAKLEALKRQVLETHQGSHQLVSYQVAGHDCWVDLNLEPQYNAAGELIGLIGAAIDITERIKMEEQLRRQAAQLLEQDRHKNEFLALLGHELRNPLSSLHIAINTLKRQASPNETANQEILALSDRQLKQLTHLINDLQDVARISQGKITLQKRRIALADVVSHAVETIMPLVNHNQQQLAVSLPEHALYIDADAERLVQVLTNLLHNAVKYTDNGGQLWLRVKQNNNSAEIQVQDTGCGIPPELLPKIFELFFQSSHGADGGLGLGLTLVQRLVELHGGGIQAFSAGPGQGSTFTLRLPLADSESATSAKQSPCAAAQSDRRILIVEDDPAVADSLTLMLKQLGHEVATVYSGEAALPAVHKFQPDVVLSDIGLPDISGYEVARRVRNRYPRQPPLLIALTGYFRDEDVQRAGKTGFDHYLLKPLDLEALKRLLEAGKAS